MSDSENTEHCRKLCCVKVGRRRCHGNISPYEKMRLGSLGMAAEKAARKMSHRRNYSAGGGVVAFVGSTEPRLVRCCAMRRDWSFEEYVIM